MFGELVRGFSIKLWCLCYKKYDKEAFRIFVVIARQIWFCCNKWIHEGGVHPPKRGSLHSCNGNCELYGGLDG
jgi:hypothetical protein